METKETKAIWDILRSLADELEKRFAPTPPVIKKLTIDPINKPDGNHKRDFKVNIQYGKAASAKKSAMAKGIDATLELEHRDDCPWM